MTTLLLSSSIFAYAASSKVYAKWYTGNAGSVDGKANGVYHSLSAGSAYLSGEVNDATSRYPVVAVLKLDRTGFDKTIGTVYIEDSGYGRHKFASNIDSSNKYYLQIGAGEHDCMHVFEGELHN